MNPLGEFLRGWKTKGRFPSVPPEVILPYCERVARYLEDSPRRSLMEEAIVEHEDPAPFKFTYDVFPFVVANFCACCQFTRETPKRDFVHRTLEDLICEVFEHRGDIDGDVIINPVEIDLLRSETPASYSDLAQWALRHRSDFMHEVFLKESFKHFGHEGGFKKLLALASQDFLYCATETRSVEAFEAVEQHVSQTFDDFFFGLGQSV